MPQSFLAAVNPSSSSTLEAVLGVDSNGNVSLWELRGDGVWSGGRLIARVKEVGRVHSARLLLHASAHLGGGSRQWAMLCGGDRACVFDLLTRSKSVVLFCALSLQVMVTGMAMMMPLVAVLMLLHLPWP